MAATAGRVLSVNVGSVRQFDYGGRPAQSAIWRIVVEGEVGGGDEIRVVERPDHDLTIRDVFRIYARDRDELERLLAVPQMSASWKGWAEHWLQKARGGG
jgi:hypothetical protein